MEHLQLAVTYGLEPPACKTSTSWPKCIFRVEKRYLHLPNPPTKMTYCSCDVSQYPLFRIIESR